jgi:hypothetical protein
MASASRALRIRLIILAVLEFYSMNCKDGLIAYRCGGFLPACGAG